MQIISNQLLINTNWESMFSTRIVNLHRTIQWNKLHFTPTHRREGKLHPLLHLGYLLLVHCQICLHQKRKEWQLYSSLPAHPHIWDLLQSLAGTWLTMVHQNLPVENLHKVHMCEKSLMTTIIMKTGLEIMGICISSGIHVRTPNFYHVRFWYI